MLSLALFAAFVADLRLQPGGESTTRTIDDLTQLAAAATASVASARRARREFGRMRWSWWFIAAGTGCWAGGQMIWSYYEILRSSATPFPSMADAGFLLLPVCATAGLLARPSLAFAGRGRLRISLDVASVLVALFTISWATSLGQVYRGGSGSVFAHAVALAYPAGDIALLTVVFTVLAYARSGGRSGLILIGTGLAGLAVADSGFAYLTAVGQYHTGNLIDAGWVAGFATLAWASVLDRYRERPPATRGIPYGTLLLPYLPSSVAIVFALAHLGAANDDTLLVAATAAMMAMLLVRQAVVVLDNAKLAERMLHQAMHDPLTGLANRAQFNDRLTHAVELRRRNPRDLALLLVDLDDFKSVNDTLGHPSGDGILVEVAKRLRATTRAGDTVARLGGDEFAVLVETEDPQELAKRVLDKLSDPIHVAGREVSAGASIGIARLSSSDSTLSPTQVLQRADVAMYAAKRSGKGAARLYAPDMSVDNEYTDMRAVLHADIAAANIDVAFQPIYLAEGTLHGVEALARWSFAGQPVPPSVFLPIARELDMAAELDEAVLRAAVAKLPPDEDTTIWINVDSRTLSSPDYAEQVADILREAVFPPHRLCIELPEVSLVEHDAMVIRTLESLRGLGVRIVVNDFGAGYATLARMRALRPDVVKIDPSLLGGADDRSAALLLDEAAVLARQIGAVVVAEGVETPAQLDAALNAGCDAVQGFLLSRPDSYPHAARRPHLHLSGSGLR